MGATPISKREAQLFKFLREWDLLEVDTRSRRARVGAGTTPGGEGEVD